MVNRKGTPPPPSLTQKNPQKTQLGILTASVNGGRDKGLFFIIVSLESSVVMGLLQCREPASLASESPGKAKSPAHRWPCAPPRQLPLPRAGSQVWPPHTLQPQTVAWSSLRHNTPPWGRYCSWSIAGDTFANNPLLPDVRLKTSAPRAADKPACV